MDFAKDSRAGRPRVSGSARKTQGPGRGRCQHRAGRAIATILVPREGFGVFAVTEVRFELVPPAAGLQSVARAALRLPDEARPVDGIDIEQPGIWTVRVIVAPASGQPLMLDAPIVIER